MKFEGETDLLRIFFLQLGLWPIPGIQTGETKVIEYIKDC